MMNSITSRLVPGWAGQVFSIEIRKTISYRFDFWIQFIANLAAQLLSAYFLWRAIYAYRGVTELGGYSFEALMLFYLFTPLVNRMIRGPEMAFIFPEIYEGTLSRYLIYPISFFGYKYVAHLAQTFIYAVQFILALIIFIIFFEIPAGVHLSGTALFMGFTIAFMGSYLYFMLASVLEMVSFWADNVWSLLVMLRFFIHILGGSMIPLSLYPDWAQQALFYLPFAYLSYFPVQCFMGHVAWPRWFFGLLVMIGWALAASAIARWMWRSGSKEYTGVGI